MSPLQLTKEEIKQLKAIHKYTHNNSMRESRIKTILLCDKNMSKEEIKEIFGVSPLKATEARDLLEIVEDRTNQSSLILTSQLPIEEWHGYLHNATIADAILDRIEIESPSQRKENAKKTMK